MSQTTKRTLTTGQITNLNTLRDSFGLSDAELDRILFFTARDAETPWIPPDILQAIALQVGKFTYVGVTFDQYIRELEQIIWSATVIDEHNRTFARSGVAKIGEAPNGVEIRCGTATTDDPVVVSASRSNRTAWKRSAPSSSQ